MFKEINNIKTFFENPRKEYSVRDAAKAMSKSPATASKILKGLHKAGILKHRKEKITDYYSAGLENEEYRDIKRYYTIRKIRESGIIEALNRQYMKPTILLYGTMTDGTDTEESDIDILIISENISEFNEKKTYEKKLGREIHIIIVRKISDVKNKHLISGMLNGTVLQGEIEWI